MTEPQASSYIPEEIAIIGGGLGGCLSALMLAKEKNPDGTPKYRITILEKDKAILNGASVIASRLHLGGEYPLSKDTAEDCLMGGVFWKLLMPKDIYTPVKPMKFLIAKGTEDEGKLTLEKYINAYEHIREQYKHCYETIRSGLKWSDKKVKKALFGSFEVGEERKEGEEEKSLEEFYRKLAPHEFNQYSEGAIYSDNKDDILTDPFHEGMKGKDIAEVKQKSHEDYKIIGGIQSREIGLNVPEYLARIQYALEHLPNVDIRYGKEVLPQNPENGGKPGIEAKDGQFTIRCANGETFKASQVITAAWENSFGILPKHADNEKRSVDVFKRSMLFINLPKGFKHPGPAFIMMDNNGGMFSPYNDKIAVCYLPISAHGGGHMAKHTLTARNPMLPEDWSSQFVDADGVNLNPVDWAKACFRKLKSRFLFLYNITEEQAKPELIVRNTINLDQELHHRKMGIAEELSVNPTAPDMSQKQLQKLALGLRQELSDEPHRQPVELENQPGLFLLQPTKATFGVYAALQVADMVNERSRRNSLGDKTSVLPKLGEDILENIAKPIEFDAYSLEKQMKIPKKEYKRYMAEFLNSHTDIPGKAILGKSIPGVVRPDKTIPSSSISPEKIRQSMGNNSHGLGR